MEAMANVGDLDSPRGSRRSHCDSTCMLMRTDAPPADNAAVLKFLSWGRCAMAKIKPRRRTMCRCLTVS